MRFLPADRSEQTARWWRHVALAPTAPVIVRELLRDDSVVAETVEIDTALAWARAQPGWREDAPALWVEEAW